MLTIFDHILIFVIVVLWPLYAAFVQYPRLKRGVAAGVPGIRVRAYIQAIVTQWTLATLALVLWMASKRQAADLGFALTGGWRLALGIVVVVVAIVLLEAQRRRVVSSAELQREFHGKIEQASALLPQNAKELFYFNLVSVTAGVCEEILFRGLLIWYLSQSIGLPLAVVGSSALFGLAHLYQGRKGIVQTGIVGLVLALVYVATGTLWVVMLLHTLVDMNSGVLWYQIKNKVDLATEPQEGGDT
jgi:membrane protease YdiL (CAAX protease family)